MSARVAVLMGSISDKETMQPCIDTLDRFGVEWEWRVLSAHRTPRETHDYIAAARGRGIQVIVCGAGMAAHLAGAAAAATTLPVIGVPVAASVGGMDALLATVQMPPGIPVATVAIGRAGAKNAAVLAVQMMALGDPALTQKLDDERIAMRDKVLAADAALGGA
jgi:5-(carboxyamino)imidazole ribonucleotide mutase